MTRMAPKVVTYGVTTVIAGQFPLALVLVDRTSLPVLLAALLAAYGVPSLQPYPFEPVSAQSR